MAYREDSNVRTVVRRLCGQFSTGPSVVCDQANVPLRVRISPSPSRKPESCIHTPSQATAANVQDVREPSSLRSASGCWYVFEYERSLRVKSISHVGGTFYWS